MQPAADPRAQLADFAHYLRSHGFALGYAEVSLMLQAAAALPLGAAPALPAGGRSPSLVSTGGTLKANGLVAVEEIVQISSRLVVNQAALKLKRAQLQPLIDTFARAVG